ncbi:MAG: hypothetical protein MK066_06870 [Crocinitomicaceae bacterium]|nr:hypothetical protein [Crocinitomicaceae bacterium]
MKLQFLFKPHKHRKFNYSPMYYDERKESLTKKRELYTKIQNDELTEDERRNMFRDSVKGQYSRAEYRKRSINTSNIRIFILIFALLALGYFLFNGVDEVDTIVKKLW